MLPEQIAYTTTKAKNTICSRSQFKMQTGAVKL